MSPGLAQSRRLRPLDNVNPGLIVSEAWSWRVWYTAAFRESRWFRAPQCSFLQRLMILIMPIPMFSRHPNMNLFRSVREWSYSNSSSMLRGADEFVCLSQRSTRHKAMPNPIELALLALLVMSYLIVTTNNTFPKNTCNWIQAFRNLPPRYINAKGNEQNTTLMIRPLNLGVGEACME